MRKVRILSALQRCRELILLRCFGSRLLWSQKLGPVLCATCDSCLVCTFLQSVDTNLFPLCVDQTVSSASHLEEEITVAPVGSGTLLPCSEFRHTHCAQERLRSHGHHYIPSSLRGERQDFLRIMNNCPQNILLCSK